MVKRRGRKRYKAQGTTLSAPTEPNKLWCTDYKGEFMLGDKRYCYPLTITDFSSRYLLACEGLQSTREKDAFLVFEHVFKEHGLPHAIRSDNGAPFSSPNALFGLSKLSVWWLRLGINIERIKPGNPQQNGRHERMHLTLKKEAAKPPGNNFLQQQAMFDDSVEQYNHDRPHQGLAMKYPGEMYKTSDRVYQGLPELDYLFHDTAPLTSQIVVGYAYIVKKISLSLVLAGQKVGIKEVSDKIWLVTFMDYDLGYFDEETCKLEPLENPFGPKVLPMSPV